MGEIANERDPGLKLLHPILFADILRRNSVPHHCSIVRKLPCFPPSDGWAFRKRGHFLLEGVGEGNFMHVAEIAVDQFRHGVFSAALFSRDANEVIWGSYRL